MANTLKSTSTSSPKLVALPSLSQLFTDSWDRLKLVGWRLVGFYVLMSFVVGGFFLLGLFGGGAAIVGANGFSNMQATLMNPATWAGIGFLALILMIGLIFLSNAFTGAIILAVDEGAKKTPFGTLLKRGFALVVPLFVVSLITQFLVMGGLFLFVIPGIAISILLSFAMYEVVLGGTRGMTALKNSVSIVSQNFWGILGRWAALIGLQMLITIILSALAGGNDTGAVFFELLSSIASMFLGIYTLVYGVLLYRAARANTNLTEGKMTWMWPVAILGWVVGGALMVLIARAVPTMYNEAIRNEMSEEMLEDYREMDDSDGAYMLDDAATSQDEESAQMYEDLLQDGEISQEEMNQLYQEALQLQQQPIE